MSNDAIENSPDQGEPIDLYRFAYGTGATTRFTYCDSDMPVEHDVDIYTPLPIERGEINASGSLDKAELEVEVPEDSPIAELFLVYPPSQVVGLTIFRCHYTGSGFTIPLAVWSGRVLSCSREGYLAKLRCEPISTSMRRVGLRRHYQYMCSHVLYGTACGVNRVDHTTLTTAVGSDVRSVTVPGQISDQHLGGIVSWTPVGKPIERRTILRVERNANNNTSRLVTAGVVREVNPGDPVEVAKGCKHTLADCRDVFGNAPAFGGFPYIPLQNPHGTTAIYN